MKNKKEIVEIFVALVFIVIMLLAIAYQYYIIIALGFIGLIAFLTTLLFYQYEIKILENKLKRFYDYDKRGVRAFVKYSTANGCWRIECYRKKTKDESKGDSDWQMLREGHIMSYDSREKAEEKVLELAEEICKQYKF